MSNMVESTATEVVNIGISVVSLHDVDDLKVRAHADIGDSRVTSIAQLVLDNDPEAMIWQDSPSLSLMLPSLVKWLFIVIAWMASLMYLQQATTLPFLEDKPVVVENFESHLPKGKKSKATHKIEEAKSEVKAAPLIDSIFIWTLNIGLLVLAYQLYKHGQWFLRLKNLRYKMSSQRLAIESGIFSKAVITYEIHELQNGQVYKPWNLRLFGRENLYVSGLWLSGIKNAEAMRDLIRNGGQIEASRIEKTRFR